MLSPHCYEHRTSSDDKISSCKYRHEASPKGQHKEQKESKSAKVYNIQHFKSDYCRPTKEELRGKNPRSSVFAKRDLFFCLENMDQKFLAGWTQHHLFPAPALKQLSNSKIQMWCITQVNYHTLINPPHIPSNAVSRAMSVLFSALNTDKPILRAWHSNRVGRSVSHSDSIWGERTSQREQSNSRNWLMHWGRECILPFLTRSPYFFPYGGPLEVGGICPGRHSGPPHDQRPDFNTSPQNVSRPSWSLGVPHCFPQFQLGEFPPSYFTVKLQPMNSNRIKPDDWPQGSAPGLKTKGRN